MVLNGHEKKEGGGRKKERERRDAVYKEKERQITRKIDTKGREEGKEGVIKTMT